MRLLVTTLCIKIMKKWCRDGVSCVVLLMYALCVLPYMHNLVPVGFGTAIHTSLYIFCPAMTHSLWDNIVWYYTMCSMSALTELEENTYIPHVQCHTHRGCDVSVCHTVTHKLAIPEPKLTHWSQWNEPYLCTEQAWLFLSRHWSL